MPLPRSTFNKRFKPRYSIYAVIFFCSLPFFQLALADSAESASEFLSSSNSNRIAALKGIRKSLEDYSSMLAHRVIYSSGTQEETSTTVTELSQSASSSGWSTVAIEDNQLGNNEMDISTTPSGSESFAAPLSRHLRSAYGRNVHRGGAGGTSAEPWATASHHHRRRRKGCPPLHGKDQLLCPSRNTHRYDVCISQQQLCDHVRDCPDGEDESPSQCFFYKPLDAQLKTLSHAVLLLVDNVMGEQQPRAEL
jgi:hypothetical protein